MTPISTWFDYGICHTSFQFLNSKSIRKTLKINQIHIIAREEHDLLEILDLELFTVRILVPFMIELFIASEVFLDSCSVKEKNCHTCLVRNMYWQSCLNLSWQLNSWLNISCRLLYHLKVKNSSRENLNLIFTFILM